MLQNRNLANCHSRASLFNLKIFLIMQHIYKHWWHRTGLKSGGNVTVHVLNHTCTCIKVLSDSPLYWTIIVIINEKFKLEQLETRTRLINWQVVQMSLFMQNEWHDEKAIAKTAFVLLCFLWNHLTLNHKQHLQIQLLACSSKTQIIRVHYFSSVHDQASALFKAI